MFDYKNNVWIPDEKIEFLTKQFESAFTLQERKHKDWDDNYELYRNKIKTNRLTQRQAVNIPIMKETIKTLLSKIDDLPNVDWKEKGGNEDKEILVQEIWDTGCKDSKIELIDLIDKKNVLMYGQSTKKLNIGENIVDIDVLDVYDVGYDPLMKTNNVETARFIVQTNIFKTVDEILNNDKYTTDGKNSLKIYIDTASGITQSEESKKQFELKMERLRSMGVNQSDYELFAGGDRLINLTEHYYTHWNSTKRQNERRVAVYADKCVLLSDELLEDVIGVKFWPFIYWSEDPENNDIYPDSIADIIRTPNKILNVWFSQLIENRTLKNFQMHWYLPSQNYTAQTYTPGPGVMLPAPPGDDINKVIKPVEISGLDDTFGAVNALIGLIEKATGATAIEKGTPEQGQQTLGEIEILVGKAQERATSMSKFYKIAWYETASKWIEISEVNKPEILNLYKINNNGKIYSKKIFSSDWESEYGYEPIISSTSEQESNNIKTIQKFNYVLTQFPNNNALRKILQSRQLKILDLTPDELKQIEEEEDRNIKQQEMMNQMPQNVNGQPQPQPVLSPLQANQIMQ